MTKSYYQMQPAALNRSADRVLGSGVLLAFETSDLIVRRVSDNAAPVVGEGTVLDRPVTDCLPVSTAHTLSSMVRNRPAPGRVTLLDGSVRSHDGRVRELLLHVSRGLGLLEALTPCGESASQMSWTSEMTRVRDRMESARSFEDACHPALELFARWTAYERFAVLRLQPEGRLHYVAGDHGVGPTRVCPDLLRLLTTGRARILPDRWQDEVPVRSSPERSASGALNLAFTELQPFFPSERQEEPGGARARWMMPLKLGGRLWGVMVAEHAREPVLLRHAMRSMLTALVAGLASRLWWGDEDPLKPRPLPPRTPSSFPGTRSSGAPSSAPGPVSSSDRPALSSPRSAPASRGRTATSPGGAGSPDPSPLAGCGEPVEVSTPSTDLASDVRDPSPETPTEDRPRAAAPGAESPLERALLFQRLAAGALADALIEPKVASELSALERSTSELLRMLRALGRDVEAEALGLSDIADVASLELERPLEVSEEGALFSGDRAALAELVRGLAARVPPGSGGWRLRLLGASETRPDGGHRLQLGPEGASPEPASGSGAGEVALLDALARRWGGRVWLTASPRAGWIALGPGRPAK